MSLNDVVRAVAELLDFWPSLRPPVAETLRMADRGLLADPVTLSIEPIRKLTAAVERLAARLAENRARNTVGATCTVEEAAILLGTTAKGIYALVRRTVEGEPTDYDIACSVNGYVGVISRYGSSVLVLDDEPMQTTVAKTRAGRVIFVRWKYAPSYEIAEAHSW